MNRHGLFRSVADQVVLRLAGVIVATITFAVLARYLGPHDLGLFTAAFAFVNFFGTFADLGVGLVVLRRGADRETLIEQLRLSLGLSLAYAIPLTVLIVALSRAFYPDPDQSAIRTGVLLLAPTMAAATVQTTFVPWFQQRGRMAVVAALDLLTRALALIAAGIVVVAGLGLTALYAGNLVAALVAVAAMVWLLRSTSILRPALRLRAWRTLAVEALPLAATTLLLTVFLRLDSFMLSWMASPTEVARYAVGYRVVQAAAMLPATVGLTLMPVLIAAWAGDRTRFVSITAAIGRAGLLVGVPVAALAPAVAAPVAELLGGGGLRSAATPLTLLLVGTCFSYVNGVGGYALIAAHREGLMLRLTAVNLVLNAVLNAVLILSHGATGAAIAFLVSEVFGAVVPYAWLARSLDWRPRWSSVGRWCACIAATGAVALATHDDARGVRVLAVAGAYLLGVALLRLVDRDELTGLLRTAGPRRAGA